MKKMIKYPFKCSYWQLNKSVLQIMVTYSCVGKGPSSCSIFVIQAAQWDPVLWRGRIGISTIQIQNKDVLGGSENVLDLILISNFIIFFQLLISYHEKYGPFSVQAFFIFVDDPLPHHLSHRSNIFSVFSYTVLYQ